MKKLPQRLAVLTLCTLPLSAFAGIIIDSSTTGWYNSGLGDIHAIDGAGGFLPGPNVSEGDPTIVLGADPGFNFGLVPAFGNDWLNGDFTGGTWSGAPMAIPSSWAINTETAIVYDFTLASTSDLHFDLGVDNGLVLWLNGSFLFGATAAGGSSPNEYSFDFAGLAAGSHRLAVLRADHGGGADFDISVDAVASVPEPGMLTMLFSGLAGLVGLRRRKHA